MSKKTLRLSDIRFDGKTQAREEIDGDTVRDYADAMKAGVEFPPLTIFFDGASNWLGDGFHRWHAAGDAGRNEIECDVRQGSKRDAILYACGANQSHGLRRTNADKRKAVVAMLADDEWRTWSNRQIAEHCGVSDMLVGDVRRQVQDSCTSQDRQSKRRTGADGKSYPAVPKHTKPTPKDADEPKLSDATDAPASAWSTTRRQCPNCGGYDFADDETGEYCRGCLEPMDTAPEPQKAANPAKVKSTVVAQCQALWDALTPTERHFAAQWFQDQLG